jgi:hypothetical protein
VREDFAVFILTHGRPENISTVRVLKEGHYTGKLFFLLDNEDETIDEYVKEYGKENIIVFDKQLIFDSTDTMELTGEHKAILFARKAVFQEAEKLKLKYFLMLEDDFTAIMFRFPEDNKLGYLDCKNLDELFSAMIDFLIESDATTVAFAQGGDFIGGINQKNFYKGLLRKAMNSFFCRTDRPIDFRGTMNEDVTAYTTLGSRGKLFFTFTKANIVQKGTQSLEGGMSEVYKDTGTFMKSFYSVMSMPSAVKIAMMGDKHYRIHHNVNWNNCVPEIINQRYKKCYQSVRTKCSTTLTE